MFLHRSRSSIVRIDNIPVIQYSRSPSVRQKWQVSKPARRFVIPWQPETPPRSPTTEFTEILSPRIYVLESNLLISSYPCPPVMHTLNNQRRGTVLAIGYQYSLSRVFSTSFVQPTCDSQCTNPSTTPIPFPFRVSFRSRSSPNYVSVSEDRFLFRYPTLPGEIESAFGGEASRSRKMIPLAQIRNWRNTRYCQGLGEGERRERVEKGDDNV